LFKSGNQNKYQDCCEACKIGLVIGSTSNSCSTENSLFGSPWDDIIEDCCTDIREADSEDDPNEINESKHIIFINFNYLNNFFSDAEDICQRIDNLCTHICVPTDDSYVCQCRDGYKLLEDNITCVKQTNVIDDTTIPQTLNKVDK
jgi:fibulin 1/2